jgi:shikimate kinase
MAVFPYRRIIVIGVTGSGKSVLAEMLAEKLNLDFIDLDALYWKPRWVESENEEFRDKVEAATQASGWVLAGNYSKVREVIWPRAEAVIWLDYPYRIVLKRLWIRTWRRWRTKEKLWGTNYERLFPQFKIWSKESLFYWQVHSYLNHKHLYPRLLASPEYAHLISFRFRYPEETQAWFESIYPACEALT